MKKGFTLIELIGIIAVLAMIILIAVPTIEKITKNSEIKRKQEDLQNIYMNAENYLMQNYTDYNELDVIGNSVYIYVMDLINQQYMDIDTLNPNDYEVFDSKDVVKITRNEDYTFSYELTSVNTLIETLLAQYNSDNTVGLVKDSTNPNLYYYTGTNEDVANNFLWYGGHQWRVLEFDTEANTITLITQQPLTSIQPASAGWTNQEEYESSYINQWLNDYFYNSLDSNIQSNIQKTTFNIGIYTDVDEITTEQNVGLLDEDQYTRAGGGNSFLDIKDVFWLGNAFNLYVRYVYYDGNIRSDTSVLYTYGVRAVIKISDITITGGDGTLTSNYQVANKATNTNEVQVGEYINVPYNGSDNACGEDGECTFRVVSKDINGIKVVLNGILPTTSKWATDVNDNITTSDLIYTNVLNSFIGNIDSKYITTGTYGVGMYEDWNSYTVPQSTIITANVGLPTVGEIFSGNDIDMVYPASGEKIFVDVTTIENPTAAIGYWTMNRLSSSSVRYVGYNGYLYSYSDWDMGGVRPVIYLNLNLKFTGGNGTAQSPYTLN